MFSGAVCLIKFCFQQWKSNFSWQSLIVRVNIYNKFPVLALSRTFDVLVSWNFTANLRKIRSSFTEAKFKKNIIQMTLQDQYLIAENFLSHNLGFLAFVLLGWNSTISPKPILNSTGYVLSKNMGLNAWQDFWDYSWFEPPWVQWYNRPTDSIKINYPGYNIRMYWTNF